MVDYKKLIDSYVPIFYLHKTEEYFPSSIDFIMDNGTLYNEAGPVDIKLDSENLFNYVSQHYGMPPSRFDKNLYISIDDKVIHGQRYDLKSVPIYAFVKETETKYLIYYSVLFPYNEGKTIVLIHRAGDHFGDVEHMTFQIDKNTNKLDRVFYGSHQDVDGRWVENKDLRMENGHVVAYIAKGGHGLYPSPGVVFRFFGFGNDLLGEHIRWAPEAILIHKLNTPGFNPARDGWIYFNGYIGYDGTSVISHKYYFDDYDLEEDKLKSPNIYGNNVGTAIWVIGYGFLPFLAVILVLIGFYQTKFSPLVYIIIVVLLLALIIAILKYLLVKYV